MQYKVLIFFCILTFIHNSYSLSPTYRAMS